MQIQNFIRQYQEYLQTNSNSQRAEKEKAYLYSELKHYGVSVWQIRKYVQQHKKELLALNKAQVLQLVTKLWNRPSHEERSLALHILNSHADKLDLSDMSLIERLMRESRGWALLDNLIIPLMPVIINKDKTGYEYLKKWIKDDDFWVRRSALLAQLLFFRKDDNGDRDLFFRMAISQFDESWIDVKYKDKEANKRAKFFIRKAIGWTLREMSAKQPEIVFKFVQKYKKEMSGFTFREATRKLPAEMNYKTPGVL